jgi:hypothetical protein
MTYLACWHADLNFGGLVKEFVVEVEYISTKDQHLSSPHVMTVAPLFLLEQPLLKKCWRSGSDMREAVSQRFKIIMAIDCRMRGWAKNQQVRILVPGLDVEQ